jgi:hypothetical protein
MELWVMFSGVIFWSTLACTHLLHMLLVQPKFGHLLHDALLVLIVLHQLLEPMYNKFLVLLYSAKHSQTWTTGISWKSCCLWTYWKDCIWHQLVGECLASFKRRKKGCQTTQRGVYLVLLHFFMNSLLDGRCTTGQIYIKVVLDRRMDDL